MPMHKPARWWRRSRCCVVRCPSKRHCSYGWHSRQRRVRACCAFASECGAVWVNGVINTCGTREAVGLPAAIDAAAALFCGTATAAARCRWYWTYSILTGRACIVNCEVVTANVVYRLATCTVVACCACVAGRAGAHMSCAWCYHVLAHRAIRCAGAARAAIDIVTAFVDCAA